LSGQQYELQYHCPAGYANSTKNIPVVLPYGFAMGLPRCESNYGNNIFDGFFSELIVVGVTWGGTNPNPEACVQEDYYTN